MAEVFLSTLDVRSQLAIFELLIGLQLGLVVLEANTEGVCRDV